MAAELALDGSVRSVPGAIAMAERAGELGIEKIVVARDSAAEAAMPAALGAHHCKVVPIEHLRDLELVGTTGEPSHAPRDFEPSDSSRSSASTSRSFADSRPSGARSKRSRPVATGC